MVSDDTVQENFFQMIKKETHFFMVKLYAKLADENLNTGQ